MPANVRVSVQQADFDLVQEIAELRKDQSDVGAVVSFVGTVRQWLSTSDGINTIELEHYPGMTEHMLSEQVHIALKRFDTLGISLIHRVGALGLGEQIVLVAVVAKHRQAAFACCEYLMDWLKTQAPFWKKEKQGENSVWVSAQEKDKLAFARWQAGETQHKWRK